MRMCVLGVLLSVWLEGNGVTGGGGYNGQAQEEWGRLPECLSPTSAQAASSALMPATNSPDSSTCTQHQTRARFSLRTDARLPGRERLLSNDGIGFEALFCPRWALFCPRWGVVKA